MTSSMRQQVSGRSTVSSDPADAEFHDSIDHVVSGVVSEVLVNQAIKAAIQDCEFCVTIADPQGADYPLIAISEAFETTTGYSRSEILGVNCRFLNQGCDMNPADLANLRIASKTGAPFTALLPNRKKSGELFLNLLDLRGLTIAVDAVTQEELWFLVGIQADVSGLAEDEIPEGHIQELQMLADGIRAKIVKELSMFALSGVVSSGLLEDPDSKRRQWVLLESPRWRPGEALGERKPTDAPAAMLMEKTYSDAAAGSRQASTGSGQKPVVEPKEPRPEPNGLQPTSNSSQGETSLLQSRSVHLLAGVLLLGSVFALLWQRKQAKR